MIMIVMPSMTTTATVTAVVKSLSLPPLFAVITDNVIDNITTVTATTHTIIVTTIFIVYG